MVAVVCSTAAQVSTTWAGTELLAAQGVFGDDSETVRLIVLKWSNVKLQLVIEACFVKLGWTEKLTCGGVTCCSKAGLLGGCLCLRFPKPALHVLASMAGAERMTCGAHAVMTFMRKTCNALFA